MKKNIKSFIVNSGLLFSGLSAVLSGMLVQVKYHMGNDGQIPISDQISVFSYVNLTSIHKISIIILTILMVLHISRHWELYGMIIRRKLIKRNIQVLTLSVLFILVAITGFLPWSIALMDGNEIIRKTIIEIHDKLAILLTIYLILHIIKRMRWLVSTFKKLIHRQINC
jgi:cytochrome b